MGNLWRTIFDRTIRVTGLQRIDSGRFEVNVKIEYDVAFGPFPKFRYLRCRGFGHYWEYHRTHRDDWVEVPDWITHEINAELIQQLSSDSNKILPLKKPA
jgi:hypothetical protein